MDTTEILKVIWPIIILQLAFQIYALVHLIKTKRTRNLTPIFWALIIIFGQIVGSSMYLLIGKSEEE